MDNRDYWTLKAMKKFGGGFVKILAEAAHHADKQNLEKIKATWPEYWKQYEGMGLKLEDKEMVCKTCGGAGEIEVDEAVYPGEPHRAPIGSRKCPDCKGHKEHDD